MEEEEENDMNATYRAADSVALSLLKTLRRRMTMKMSEVTIKYLFNKYSRRANRKSIKIFVIYFKSS